MASTKYEKAKELKTTCKSQAIALKESLEQFKDNCDKLYQLLRWEGLDCSDEEYENIAEHFTYKYEDNSVDYSLGEILDFITELTKEN